MPLNNNLPKSPFEIIKPEFRWTPDVSEPDMLKGLLPPLVKKIREEVYEWRQFGYDQISETSKSLLNFWFKGLHPKDFQYYFAQRESVETIIYLYESKKIRTTKDLFKFLSWGNIKEEDLNDLWLRLVIKQATGTGKTKVITLLLAWSYFHKLYEPNSELSQNYLIITPNTIVLDRIISDFEDLKIFSSDPIIPPNGYNNKNWKMDFKPKLHIQDEIKKISPKGNIFLTNIQRFANREENEEILSSEYFLAPKPVRETKDNKLKVKNVINEIDDLLIFNDEAHHIHEDNAWKRTIQNINNIFRQKNKSLAVQVDVTATPRDKKGGIFFETICDYPIVEAIHQEIVKKPVIPDQASRSKLKEYSSSRFSEQYRDYLNLGVEVWQKQYNKHLKMKKKALLFVMVDDTTNCNDVAQYLENTFSILKNSVFTIHTKSTNGVGSINENSSKGKEELKILRRLVNTVDNIDSPIKVIVSVLMLKEGWDVKNVTTIVGLRAYASNILPEQTLGRGLRKMYFQKGIDEELDVIGTQNFIDFVDRITEEGVELEERGMGGDSLPSGPLIIEIDEAKNVEQLDIGIPQTNSTFNRDYLSLDLLDVKKFQFKAQEIKLYSEKESTKKIIFRDILTTEVAYEISFDSFKSLKSSSVIGFFSKTIIKELRLVGVENFIYEKLRLFIREMLFGKIVDLDDINILRNLSDSNIVKLIIDLFKSEINNLTLRDMGFTNNLHVKNVSNTEPYMCSRKKEKYSFKPVKSIFNIFVGDNMYERNFGEFLDTAEDVISFFKNDIQLQYSIEYVKYDGSIGRYHPDFFIKLSSGDVWVVETKGAENLNDQRKFERLKVWCEEMTKSKNQDFNCLYIRYELWQKLKPIPNKFSEVIEIFNKNT